MGRFFRFDDLSHQPGVGVVNLVGINGQMTPGFYCRRVVIELTRLTGSFQGIIQLAADAHVAHAVNLRMMLVVERAGADIQPVTGRNDRSFAVLCGVIQGPRLEGELVPVNPSGAGVGQGVSREMGQTAVYQSRIIQGVVNINLRFPGADFRGLSIGKVFGGQLHGLPG
ncbi:hypothetical protein AM629_21335, partial [Photorhabdus heterorhabditis]